jgi:hypothetical protein
MNDQLDKGFSCKKKSLLVSEGVSSFKSELQVKYTFIDDSTRTAEEPSLRNVLLNKNRTMDNVQNVNNSTE